jgi:uncharacterized RDD family membrane protein YckC
VDTPENPARWAADPLGRHQYRYWDGAQWTEHVADDGMVANDPLTATAPTTPVFPGGLVAPQPETASFAMAAAGARQPTAADPTSVLGRRYGAFLIDATICVFVFGLLFFPFATQRTRAETLRLPGCHLAVNDSSRVECDNRVVLTVNDTVYEANIGAFVVLSVLFTLLYFALMEALTGGSLGKHLTGIRVVTASGERIGFARSLARWALFAIDGPLSLFLCGIITSSVSHGHRRLGDMAASSYVVARHDAGRPVVVP